tara:strand:+ start:171 stop:356 length:186 start_codon:yes stop_codon:yes gene_type:complete
MKCLRVSNVKGEHVRFGNEIYTKITDMSEKKEEIVENMLYQSMALLVVGAIIFYFYEKYIK